MENQPKRNTDNDQLGNPLGQDNGSGRNNLRNDNSGSDDLNAKRPETGTDAESETRNDDTDKYLAMEQPGVTYTKDTDFTLSSDQAGLGDKNDKQWNEEGGNSRYSDAFNQDDYLLEDNLDLDEDQNQSISSDDEDFEETNERY